MLQIIQDLFLEKSDGAAVGNRTFHRPGTQGHFWTTSEWIGNTNQTNDQGGEGESRGLRPAILYLTALVDAIELNRNL